MDVPRGLDRFSQFTSRREVANLERVLEDGEDVLHAVEARRDGKQGLLVCTKARIVWMSRGLVKDDVQAWGQEALERIRVEPEGPYGRILLDHGEVDEDGKPTPATAFDFVQRDRAEAFALAVKSLHSGADFRQARPVRDKAFVTPRAPAPLTELEKRLVRLEDMRKKGSLSADEYAYARRHLLESLGLPGDLPAPSENAYNKSPKQPVPAYVAETATEKARRNAPPVAPKEWPGEKRVENAKTGKPNAPPQTIPKHGANVKSAGPAPPKSPAEAKHLQSTSAAAGRSLAEGHEKKPRTYARGLPKMDDPKTLGDVHGGALPHEKPGVPRNPRPISEKPRFDMPNPEPPKPVKFGRANPDDVKDKRPPEPKGGAPKTFKITKQPPKGKK